MQTREGLKAEGSKAFAEMLARGWRGKQILAKEKQRELGF